MKALIITSAKDEKVKRKQFRTFVAVEILFADSGEWAGMIL